MRPRGTRASRAVAPLKAPAAAEAVWDRPVRPRRTLPPPAPAVALPVAPLGPLPSSPYARDGVSPAAFLQVMPKGRVRVDVQPISTI